jgi:uncharacterized cupin superfamily protein
VIANWNDVDGERLEKGHLCGTWRDLGTAAGSQRVGVNRIEVEPGRWSTPAHAELAAEEIFFVVGGSGMAWQDTTACEIAAGDCIVHRLASTHTFRAGDDGLDLLAFGERNDATYTHFPRVGAIGNYPGVMLDVSQGPRAWDREAQAGEPEFPAARARPDNIVNAHTVEPEYEGPVGRWALMGRKAGAERTGLNWARLEAGQEGAPPHCHSVEEELFVVLEGTGTLELWPSPVRAENGRERESYDLRAGDVVSRPAGTGMAHLIRAGDEAMTFLAYGTRDTSDVCYYPRSNKIYWRGVGLIARLDHLSYDDGEPHDEPQD